MTRLIYQNTGSLEISIYSHKFEVICEAMYNNEMDIGCLVETNNALAKYKNDKKD